MQLKKICKVIPNNYKLSDNRDTIRYLDTGNLTKNHINNIAIYDNSSDLPSRAKQKVCKGNILFGSVRPEQCHYGYVNRDTSNLLVSTGFIVLTVDESLANSKFIYYRLTRNEIVKNLQSIAQLSTSAYPSITSDDILDLKIDLPDRKIQDKIADLLTKIDNQIERNNKMVQSLQVLGKSVYCKNRKDNVFSLLKDVSEISTGKEDANHARSNGKYKFFTCSEDHLLCDDYKFDGKYVLVAGNGNFNVKFYDGKFNAYQRTYTIKNDELFGNLYYTLLYNTNSLKKQSNGSIIKFITIDMLNRVEVPCFSVSINKSLNNIISEICSIKNNSEKLQHLKNILLPLLMNGELQ